MVFVKVLLIFFYFDGKVRILNGKGFVIINSLVQL
jgi:hypothetical protein